MSRAKATAPAAAAATSEKQQQISGSRRGGRSCKARSLACRECRDRKIRCDGARPVCDSCNRRGLGAGQCVYPEVEHEGSIASSRSYIRALQKRVQELEQREKQQQQLEPSTPTGDTFIGTTPSRDDAWTKSSASPNVVFEQLTRPPKPLDHVLPPIQPESHYPLPSLVSLPVRNDSPAYLHHHHRPQMGHSPPLTDDLEENHLPKSNFGSYSTNVKAALMLEKITLPPSDLMDDLLNEYFDYDWLSLPIVHRHTFYQRYRHLVAVANSRYRRDISLDEATELAATHTLLLGMLAVGQITKLVSVDPSSIEMSSAYEFHQQAKTLLLVDLLSAPSLSIVQALLVHSRFLRRAGLFQESWTLSGMAYRLAEGLMLHMDLPGKTHIDREEQRRTWCSCVLLLRMQNLGRKQPTTKPLSFGILPEEADDEYTDNPSLISERRPSAEVPLRISFFIQILKLSDTVLQPIQELHFDQAKHDETESIASILGTALKLDCELEGWYAGLPQHLVSGYNSAQGHATFQRQAILLRMRYLETRALITRLSLIKLAKCFEGKPISTVAMSTISGLFEACYTSSVALADIMTTETRLIAASGPPESHTVISLCILGTTLAMLIKHPLLRDTIANPTPVTEEATRCLSLARQYSTHRNSYAEHHLQALETALQSPMRPTSGVVDPALEAKSTGYLMLDIPEMTMLDAWHFQLPTSPHEAVMEEMLCFW